MEQVKRSSITLRLPAAIREWLAEQAKTNFTSQNAEIIRALRERMAAGTSPEKANPAAEFTAALQGSSNANHRLIRSRR